MKVRVLATFVVLLACVATPAQAATPTSCGLPGPDRVITGAFSSDLQGSYVLLPFQVPPGQTAVRVRYCNDQPETPLSAQFKHTLDLDMYGPRSPGGLWGPAEFRGSSGSAKREGEPGKPQVTISADGYTATTGATTRSMRAGPITPGEWAVQLPVAAVVDQSQGDLDGKVAFRVEIDVIDSPAFADEPYRPAPYRTEPARREQGWYAGDLHVHADHSEGGATMRKAFDFAFKPGGAGLDFVSLTDHNTDSAYGEIGSFQPDYPGKLVIRGAEVTTFRGHLMNHGTGRYVDHRTGRVFEGNVGANGALEGLTLRRPARPAGETLRDIKAAGGFNQINHPTIFPSEVPAFANLCRGCSWSYSDAETDYSSVDSIEIATGPSTSDGPDDPGPNPFTATAIDFWEQKLAQGFRIAAVGASDSHEAGEAKSTLQAPIGEATTVVRADELSESGVECGVEAGHTYVKVTGNGGPDIRFEGRPPGPESGPAAIMGDTVQASSAQFTVRVMRGSGRTLTLYRDDSAISTVPVTSDDFSTSFPSSGLGRYRLQLDRGSTIETVSSPIYLEPGPGTIATRDCSPLRVRGKARRRMRLGRRGILPARCIASGAGLRVCNVQIVTRVGKRGNRRVRVIGRRHAALTGGSRRLRVRLSRYGRRVVGRHRRGRQVRLVFIASDDDGASARFERRVRLVRPARRR